MTTQPPFERKVFVNDYQIEGATAARDGKPYTSCPYQVLHVSWIGSSAPEAVARHHWMEGFNKFNRGSK